MFARSIKPNKLKTFKDVQIFKLLHFQNLKLSQSNNFTVLNFNTRKIETVGYWENFKDQIFSEDEELICFGLQTN